MNTENKMVIDDYEWGHWAKELGSIPIELIDQDDFGECYETDFMRIYLLENGKYASVSGIGCSCWCTEDAGIDLFPDRASALEALRKYRQERKREKHGL